MINSLKSDTPEVETVSFNADGEIEQNPLIKRLFLLLVIVLVSTLSFGLGRLSNKDTRAGVKIEFDPSLSAVSLPTTVTAPADKASDAKPSVQAPAQTGSTKVVGSVNSTKYHFSHCPGAKQIASANLITFQNPAAAEAAGYTLALNCKPK